MHGLFPGSAAPLAADCVLLSEIAMGLALIAGAILARHRRYRAHAWCQSAVVLLNLLLIALYMVPSFRVAVAPGLFKHIGRSYYWLAAAHGVLGIGAELLGIYILLVAGTNILPQRCRFTRYKPWMRSALALWWLVLLLGLATYVRWYGVPFRSNASTTSQQQSPSASNFRTTSDILSANEESQTPLISHEPVRLGRS